MKYLEFTFHTTPCTEIVNDVLSAVLGEAGFESFVEQTDGIAAYIQKDLYNETVLKEALADFPLPDTQVEYAYQEAEDKDWNEEWEKNFFQPIVIGDRCCIHSTFHKDTPKTEYEILINPQMAFGTGHHETTSSIISELLNADLKDKSVLDMGCGTSILAILASMRGANPVTAIDIDDCCVNNSKDNIILNQINNILIINLCSTVCHQFIIHVYRFIFRWFLSWIVSTTFCYFYFFYCIFINPGILIVFLFCDTILLQHTVIILGK